MRFLADENIPISTIAMLRSLGHDVIHTIELELQGANDRDLFNIAIKKKRHFLTKDLDFSNILTYHPTKTTGILVLRIKDNRPGKLNSIFKQFLKTYQKDFGGKLIIVTENKFRIRKI